MDVNNKRHASETEVDNVRRATAVIKGHRKVDIGVTAGAHVRKENCRT